MRGRTVVLSLAVVGGVVAAAGWMSLRQKPDSGVAPVQGKSAAAPTKASPAQESPAPEIATAPSPPPEVPLQPSRTPTSEPVAAESSTPEKIETSAVDGGVVVLDAQGREHREESGTLRPKFFRRIEETPEAIAHDVHVGQAGEVVSVDAGRFHVEVPLGQSLGVEKLVLGGREALSEEEPVEIKAGEPVTIRARWIDGITLHVVDATSRAELDEVTVAHSKEQHFFMSTYPGAAERMETVVDHGVSPVLVAPQDGQFGFEKSATLFVRAAGHAWKKIELDFARMTESTVELGPAATLVVDVAGELPHRDPPPPSLKELGDRIFGGRPQRSHRAPDLEPMLRLRAQADTPDFDAMVKGALDRFDTAKPEDFPGGRKPTLEEFKSAMEQMRGLYEMQRAGYARVSQPATLGETRLESLEPGDFDVSVEVGDEGQMPLVAGKVAVRLVAGETARATLVLAAVAPPATVPLAGTLFVPAGWDVNELRLSIQPIDLPGASRGDEKRIAIGEMVALPGRPGCYRWSAGDVLPATWRLDLQSAGFFHDEKLGPSGNDHVELKLGEPAKLIVRVVDGTSGRPIELQWLQFVSENDGLLFGFAASINLEYERDRSVYLATVPVGGGTLESFGGEQWSLDPERTRVDVHSGSQQITLQARRTCGLVLALSCNGANVAWPSDFAAGCKIDPVGSDGHMSWVSFRTGQRRFAVTTPGRYRVTIPAIPGYAPVDPFEIEVPAGEFVMKTVELTRK
jgi:hypothetical protein